MQEQQQMVGRTQLKTLMNNSSRNTHIKRVWDQTTFLGGLSLHLNHLIGSQVRNYDWPFGTLPFGIFGSNLDTMDLETYPRTYSGQFWHCHFLTIPGPFEYFQKMGALRKSKFSWWRSDRLGRFWFSLVCTGP